MCALLLAITLPGVCHAGRIAFETPGLEAPSTDLPKHDSVLLVLDGWEKDRFEGSILQSWRDRGRGDSSGETFGLKWTGPFERDLVTDETQVGESPLRVEVKIYNPTAKDQWKSKRKVTKRYGPVTIRDTYFRLTRTTELRVDVIVRSARGGVAHAETYTESVKESGDWEPEEEHAKEHANSPERMAMGLIDEIAPGLLDDLAVVPEPRSFWLNSSGACRESRRCMKSLAALEQGNNLLAALRHMAKVESPDPWVAYNAAVLSAALHRYSEARTHLTKARLLDDKKPFRKLLERIKEWEQADRRLIEGGYPLEPPQ
jgi:hypothetical protein